LEIQVFIITHISRHIYNRFLIIIFIVVLSIKHVGLRRGDIVVALKLCAGDGGGGREMDVRWETCRRVAEFIVHHHQRRRKSSSGEGAVIQLKVVTPITAAAASDGYQAVDPNKVPTCLHIYYVYGALAHLRAIFVYLIQSKDFRLKNVVDRTG